MPLHSNAECEVAVRMLQNVEDAANSEKTSISNIVALPHIYHHGLLFNWEKRFIFRIEIVSFNEFGESSSASRRCPVQTCVRTAVGGESTSLMFASFSVLRNHRVVFVGIPSNHSIIVWKRLLSLNMSTIHPYVYRQRKLINKHKSTDETPAFSCDSMKLIPHARAHSIIIISFWKEFKTRTSSYSASSTHSTNNENTNIIMMISS